MFPIIHLGSILVPSYYLILSLTFCICIVWAFKRAHRLIPDKVKQTMDLGIIICISGFIGARLGHVFIEAPEFSTTTNIYFQQPLRILYFWEGGFVFYVGALTAFLTTFFYFKIKNISVKEQLQWLDFFTPLIALGYGLGRIACLAAGCCYGKICTLPWGIQLPVVDGWPSLIHRHPTQIYASLSELLIIFPLVLLLENKKLSSGKLFFAWLSLHSLSRLVMEHYRDDFRGNFYFGLSISSIFSLLFLTIAIYYLLKKGEMNADFKSKTN